MATSRPTIMHIPDGFIDAKTAAVAAVLSVTGIGFAVRQVRRNLPPRRVPLLGLAAAFLFAAEMVNFPVAGGTSGHLIGGTLVAVLLGPSAAVVVLTTVLIVQCFLFADGGVLALGANVFNMGIVATLGGYAVFRIVRGLLPGLRGQVAAVVFAGWCSTVLAAIACAGQLAWSGTVAWAVGFYAMTGIQMLVGLGEGAISALVWLAIARTRPDLVWDSGVAKVPRRLRELVVLGLLATVGLALFVAPFACGWPDGLEKAAATLGFGHRVSETLMPAAPMANYKLPGVASGLLATALAGVIGVLILFWLVMFFLKCVAPRAGAAATEASR